MNDNSRASAQPRRADAERNRDAIIESALTLLERNSAATMAQIATAAGVGRVTLYGHFSSRDELVDAAFRTAVARSERTLANLDLGGNPVAALVRLIHSSWREVVRNLAALDAAQRALPPERIREHHSELMACVEDVIARGQAEGAFRADLSAGWLTACFYAVLHVGSDEVLAGRASAEQAAEQITATVLGQLSPTAAGLRGPVDE
ncbi:TetR family transcriptional regulator [Lysinibacter cavernae]|uniref:AcrR family transcriptional regulator n=1 Tax=Lysinibacter cavernae TaxID=1640652 RepID=A0A7X5TTQ5_9MICO|nr:AcrR family transcriptional regulator [Lysinibacter cavernae]